MSTPAPPPDAEAAAPPAERRGVTPALSPAEMRAFIVERLVGDTGEPEKVLAAAQNLAERAQPLFLAALGGLLATKLSVEIKSVEIARTRDAKALTDNGHLLVVASGSGASDTATLLLDRNALALAVSAMFGGDPTFGPSLIQREPSPVEVDVAAALFEALAGAFNEGAALGLDLPLPEVKAGAALKAFTPRDGPAARVTLRLAAGGHGGDITVFVLQRILLGRRGPTLGVAAAPSGFTSGIGGEVMRSSVTVEAMLPLTRTTLGAISALVVGEVVAFDDGALAQARLLVRGKPVFSGEFGRLGAQFTVRVREPFSEARDFMETLLPG